MGPSNQLFSIVEKDGAGKTLSVQCHLLAFIENSWLEAHIKPKIIIPFQGELLPAHARSIGSGLVGFMENVGLFFSCKLVPTWFELLGIHGAYIMYSAICLAVAILSFFFMPETLGRSLEEIEDMYRPKSKKIIKPADSLLFEVR